MANFTITEVCYTHEGARLNCRIQVNSGTLLAIFGKVVPQDVLGGANPTPWNYLPTNPPTQGSAANQEVIGVPTNGMMSGSLFIWVVCSDGGSSFHSQRFDYQIPNGSGSGSGSGTTINPCSQNFASSFALAMEQPLYQSSVRDPGLQSMDQQGADVVPDAMPRVYKMMIDIGSLPLGVFGAGHLAAGLLASANLYLTYDEHISTPTTFVWSGKNLTEAGGRWTLRIECNGGPARAMLCYQQIGQPQVSKPILWTGQSWRFLSSNKLTSERSHSNPLAFPSIRVEPA